VAVAVAEEPNAPRTSEASRGAGNPASLVHEAQPGRERLEVPAAAAALVVAVGRADDPPQEQRAHGPALPRRPSSPALPVPILAARVAPVAAAAERARMVRRRAEARELGRRRSTGRGGFGSGPGGGCRGHVFLGVRGWPSLPLLRPAGRLPSLYATTLLQYERRHGGM
jgi:hypothetical protein